MSFTEELFRDKSNAAIIVESVYGLSAMKDELMKRIYGRADVTPLERQAIDKAKLGVK